MKFTLKILFILLCASNFVAAQKYSPEEIAKLKQAEKTADVFIEDFRRTLDFGTVWKKFRSEKYKCRLIKSDLITSINDDKKMEIGIPLLERAYIAFFDGFFLGSAYLFSKVSLNSDETVLDEFTAKDRVIKRIGTYKNLEPETKQEIKKFIIKARQAAQVIRKNISPNAMRNSVWRENLKYMTTHEGRTGLSNIRDGNEDFCLSKKDKIYTVDKGVFFFYFAEEKGKMKILDFEFGN